MPCFCGDSDCPSCGPAQGARDFPVYPTPRFRFALWWRRHASDFAGLSLVVAGALLLARACGG